MSILVITLLLASMVSAQVSHVIHGFEYVGCVSVTSDKFNAFVNFGRAYTPEECQSACTGRNYAAAFPDGCRCGSSLVSFPLIDESLCSKACTSDPKFGFCGFSNSEGCSYANVYKACNENTFLPSSSLLPGGPASTETAPSITFITIQLPTITRTRKLATKSTVVIHTVTPGDGVSNIPCNSDYDRPPATLTKVTPSSRTIAVQTVVIHVPPKSASVSGLQTYGSVQLDPPVATVPPAETPVMAPQPTPDRLSLTSLVPYDPVPGVNVPTNTTVLVVTSTPDEPMFQTLIMPDDPSAITATFTPAIVTKSPALRTKLDAGGAAGVVAAFLIAAGI
ncbi:uncharacterized protein LY79DRAFT_518816 [Colletotrichum navitas]|uniref:WSC domain-containing protein n=1 Tax=Colletotrichum navitas TaxID=681940 RepID=A0AAD8PWM6_9PEZI|nr:uncharacterized protein LY79DRAFT_518816 [Colletotrichum navitas]KAK1585480.1 hypothetical protein LY79DRAFT_518816 [Colletotrichum navitas]